VLGAAGRTDMPREVWEAGELARRTGPPHPRPLAPEAGARGGKNQDRVLSPLMGFRPR